MGYAFSDRIDTQLMLAALDIAYCRRKPPKGLIFHSDRGVQYTAKAYRERLETYDIRLFLCPFFREGLKFYWSATVYFKGHIPALCGKSCP